MMMTIVVDDDQQMIIVVDFLFLLRCCIVYVRSDDFSRPHSIRSDNKLIRKIYLVHYRMGVQGNSTKNKDQNNHH